MLCISCPDSIPALTNQSTADFERETGMILLALKLFKIEGSEEGVRMSAAHGN